jgi:hypothetical protein
MVKLITTLNVNERGFHMEEILYCLDYNLKHPLIDDITIIFDISDVPDTYNSKTIEHSSDIPDEIKDRFHTKFISFLDDNDNVFFMIIKERPTYKVIFDYTDKINELWILCNADIYYPYDNKEILKIALSINYDTNLICLTRYDKIINEKNHYTKFYDGYKLTYENNDYKTQYTNGCSIDTWIYKSPIKSINCNYNIEMGRIGCDGMMNYQLAKSYNVINPCRDVISIHNHKEHILYTTNLVIDYQNIKYKYNDYIKMMKKRGFLLKNIPFSYIDSKNLIDYVNIIDTTIKQIKSRNMFFTF